jgi:hypothetical protein
VELSRGVKSPQVVVRRLKAHRWPEGIPDTILQGPRNIAHMEKVQMIARDPILIY